MYKYLEVYAQNELVGRLASIKSSNKVAFAYADSWIENGYSISPFSLPLQKGPFIPKADVLDGMFGVFSDSLPDGWGRLLVDRMLIKNGINPEMVDNLNRLAIVGDSGMGNLEYRPIHEIGREFNNLEFDRLAKECKKILDNQDSSDLDTLFYQGGSSGGARPKVFIQYKGEDWIVKFPSSFDEKNIGLQEYNYMLCAKKCGLNVPEFCLFDSKVGSGYFGVKRFDRNGLKKIPMISVAGLLETSHRTPNLDYNILMKLVLKLTNNYDELEEMFKRMCFNVFSHNRDDHSKNFSFLYIDGQWRLSPVYDLTYSSSLNGEHATTINGNGVNPSIEDIVCVASKIGLNVSKSKQIATEIKNIVERDLKQYL